MFSHGGCRVFLLDVSHVVERRSSTAREARERNGRRRLKYIGPSDKFLDFFLYFRDFSLAPPSPSFPLPILPLFTCPHRRELGRKEVRHLYRRKPTPFCLAYREVDSRLSANFKCPFIAPSFRQDKLLLTGFLPFSRLLPPDTIKSWRTSTIVVPRLV